MWCGAIKKATTYQNHFLLDLGPWSIFPQKTSNLPQGKYPCFDSERQIQQKHFLQHLHITYFP